MSDTNDEFTLNEQDFWLINTVLVGSTKLICNIIHKNPKNRAKSLSYNFKKHLAHDESINIVKKIGDSQRFRRKDIWQKLSEDEQYIHDADLTRILTSLRNLRLSGGAKGEITNKKWGRPPTSNPYVSNTPGPKSFYELTDFYKYMRKGLSNPHILKIIYSVLFHSGMIHRLVTHIIMITFHVIKLNDEQTAWKLLKSHYPIDRKEQDFHTSYSRIHSIEDTKELKELASRRAASYVKKRKAKDYITILEDGGLAYPSKL